MFTIIKIGPYSPIKNGLTKYNSLKLLTLNKFDPEINQEQVQEYLKDIKTDFSKFDCVLISELNRAKSTFKYLIDNYLLSKNLKVVTTPSLNEILLLVMVKSFSQCLGRKGSRIRGV